MRAPDLMLAALAALVIAGPLPAVAQTATGNYGRITAYNRAQIRVFDAEGRALERMDRGDLPANAVIVDIRPGGGLGILVDGSVVYVRGIDVEFDLNEAGAARCAPASGAGRAEGQISTGTYAGGGASTDCRLGAS